MATVSIFLPSMSGTTGNTLWLYKSSDYSLVNTGGDALTESGTSGWFTATVAEAWTETLAATVLDTNSLASGYGWLAVGATQISDGTAVLDSANIRAAVGLASGNLDTQLASIAQNAVVASTAASQLLGPDSNVSAEIRLMLGLDSANLTDRFDLIDYYTNTIYRSVNDNNPIKFIFSQSGITPSPYVSFNNSITYQAASGTVSYLGSDNGFYTYSLSYNASDRPSSEGTARYKFSYNGVNKYLNLVVGDDVTASAIKVKTDQLTFTAPNKLDVSVHSVSQSGFSDIFETYTLGESYPASGVEGTPAQTMYLVQQGFLDFTKDGASITINKLDGTQAATYSLDSATRPTLRTRAT